ncbi:MAG: hypothetical protein ACT4OJ_15100 [Bacteroidota bacterium]
MGRTSDGYKIPYNASIPLIELKGTVMTGPKARILNIVESKEY